MKSTQKSDANCIVTAKGIRTDRGIVDQDIQTAQFLIDRLKDPLHILRIRDISHHPPRLG